MISLLLCGLIAGACAAPQFDFGGFERPQRPLFSNYHLQSHPYVDDNVFDTGRFWSDLSKELKDLDDMLADFTRRFPKSVSQEGVEGNEYKITISLPDFDEKDIVVKARTGLLMIQASHKYAEGSERNYLDVRTLPENVNVTGNWVFEAGVLKITFPLNGTPVEPIPRTVAPRIDGETTTTTIAPIFEGSREEIEAHENDVQDVDVGLGRGDLGKETELKTNVIPDRHSIEATTYAVDLKDEVEFVPVRY